MYYIFLLIFLILLSVGLSYFNTIEHFENVAKVYTTSIDNNSNWMYNDVKTRFRLSEVINESLNTFLNDVRSAPEKLYGGETLYICDPYDYEHDFSKFEIVAKSRKGYFIGVVDPVNAFRMSCILDFMDKKIGYYDHSDLYFIKSIIHGYRMDKSRIELIQLKKEDFTNLKYTLISTVDIIITFVIPDSKYCNLIQTQPISIMGFGNLDFERVRLFYPYTTKETVENMSSLFLANKGSTALILARENNTYLPAMSLYLIRLYGSTEKFITRLENDPSYYDPSYKCYGDLNIDNKELCDSPYDVIGLPKLRYTTWDKPCILDSECPYYDANKKRGGCLTGGICEMPVGVKRIGYRKNLNTGPFAPFCYGCKDAYDTTCCNMNADYAFPEDNNNNTLPFS